jgi:hypothetical protein
MPAISDLDGVRESPLRSDRIAAPTIPGDDTDLRVQRQPRLSRRRLPIGQKGDRRATLKVADQRAVAVIASPGPVIDADNRRRRKASRPTAAHHTQQRVIAHDDIEPARKGGCRPASERNRETVDHVIQPARPSRSWFDGLEPFGKDLSRARFSIAEEAAGPQNQRYPDAGGRKIGQPPPILAVHTAASASARRAAASARRGSYCDDEAVAVFHRALNDESARNKLRNVKPLHDPDPQLESEPNRRLDFIKCESDPNIDPIAHEVAVTLLDNVIHSISA